MSSTELDVEALARKIAGDHIYDWVTGPNWYGYPKGEEEEVEAEEDYMPTARRKALEIVKLLTGEDYG